MSMDMVYGTENDDRLQVTTGGIFTGGGDDRLILVAQEKTGQIHSFAGSGDDWTDLSFSNITVDFSHGHHARGDVNGGGNQGADVFNFANTHNISSGQIIVGRIEDFDYSRDTIMLEGEEINLLNLPKNIRILEFNGAHNDRDTGSQQWIEITTAAGGIIFYALEGARADMNDDGEGNKGDQERHFILESQLPDLDELQEVKFVDQQNVIPAGFITEDGLFINDYDEFSDEVLETIIGSDRDDLIAAGLNDDVVEAGRGSDHVWGGSGNDVVRSQDGDDFVFGGTGEDQLFAGSGNDYIEGGFGHDKVFGESGNDVIYGGGGNDQLEGSSGEDVLYGQKGQDRILGGSGDDTIKGNRGKDQLFGGSGDDKLIGGGGSDYLKGGGGRDNMTGNGGRDSFVFNEGDLVDWDQLSGSWGEKCAEIDIITDFQLGQDKIVFDGSDHAASVGDLKVWKCKINDDWHFAVEVKATNERLIVNLPDDTTWSEFVTEDHFFFT